MIQRLPTWQSNLQALIAERWSQPFELGRHDCYLFAADCVLAITGHDIAAYIRGQYSNEITAARILVAAGGLELLLSASLGESIPTSLAQVGDVGLHQVDGSPAAAVCAGTRWLAAGIDGLALVPDGGVIKAWRCC